MAISQMKEYGDYELWELRYWNTWQPIKRNAMAHSIRTDTMEALRKRGLVKVAYDPNRIYNFTATLTDEGLKYEDIRKA